MGFLVYGDLEVALENFVSGVPGGISILYPLALYLGFPGIVGIFFGQITATTIGALINLEAMDLTWSISSILFLELIPLALVYWFVMRRDLRHGKFFLGCWVLTGLLLLFVYLIGARAYAFFRLLFFLQFFEINVFGFLLLQTFRIKTRWTSGNMFSVLGGFISLLSIALPWLARPPAYMFLWGFSFGPMTVVGEINVETLFFWIPLILVLVGALLSVISKVITYKEENRHNYLGKALLICSGLLGAFGLLAFVTLPFPLDFEEMFELFSYGIFAQGLGITISLFSVDY